LFHLETSVPPHLLELAGGQGLQPRLTVGVRRWERRLRYDAISFLIVRESALNA
jgi:hypothetical protein